MDLIAAKTAHENRMNAVDQNWLAAVLRLYLPKSLRAAGNSPFQTELIPSQETLDSCSVYWSPKSAAAIVSNSYSAIPVMKRMGSLHIPIKEYYYVDGPLSSDTRLF
jgi:hypothetical protein